MPDRAPFEPTVVEPTVFEPTVQILAGVVLAQVDLLRSTVPPPGVTPQEALAQAADALEQWARAELGPTAWDAFVAGVRLRAARDRLRYGAGGRTRDPLAGEALGAMDDGAGASGAGPEREHDQERSGRGGGAGGGAGSEEQDRTGAGNRERAHEETAR